MWVGRFSLCSDGWVREHTLEIEMKYPWSCYVPVRMGGLERENRTKRCFPPSYVFYSNPCVLMRWAEPNVQMKRIMESNPSSWKTGSARESALCRIKPTFSSIFNLNLEKVFWGQPESSKFKKMCPCLLSPPLTSFGFTSLWMSFSFKMPQLLSISPLSTMPFTNNNDFLLAENVPTFDRRLLMLKSNYFLLSSAHIPPRER